MCNIWPSTFVLPYKPTIMRTFFQGKSVVVIALLIAILTIAASWMALSQASGFCNQADEACNIMDAKPVKGRIIWDEITRGFLASFPI